MEQCCHIKAGLLMCFPVEANPTSRPEGVLARSDKNNSTPNVTTMAPTLKKPFKMLRALSERFITPAGSTDSLATKPGPDGFLTAKGIDALFTRTKPEIDGEDCLHDCASCTIHYPRKFETEQDDKLYGEIKGWSRHLIVATGKSDWVRDVEDEKGSVMESVGKHIGEVGGGRLMLSASNIPTPDHHSEGPYGKDRPTTVLLLPAFQFVEGVTPNLVSGLIKSVVNTTSTNTQPLRSHDANGTNGTDGTNGASDSPEQTPLTALNKLSVADLPAGISIRPCPHKYLILICSQATRDARCGQSAPLLRKELERHLRPLGLFRDLGDDRPGGVGIYFISHVGGHKYSANMMIYRKAEVRRTVPELIQGAHAKGDDVAAEAAQCIWLARIKPEDCENLVKFTILQGKVVKPDSQLRMYHYTWSSYNMLICSRRWF